MSQFFLSQTSSFVNSSNVVLPLVYPYEILKNNQYIIVNASVANTIILPDAPVGNPRYVIKDGTGDSGANPITIDGNGNTIDDLPTYVIQSSWGFVGVLWNGTQWNVINQ